MDYIFIRYLMGLLGEIIIKEVVYCILKINCIGIIVNG